MGILIKIFTIFLLIITLSFNNFADDTKVSLPVSSDIGDSRIINMNQKVYETVLNRGTIEPKKADYFLMMKPNSKYKNNWQILRKNSYNPEINDVSDNFFIALLPSRNDRYNNVIGSRFIVFDKAYKNKPKSLLHFITVSEDSCFSERYDLPFNIDFEQIVNTPAFSYVPAIDSNNIHGILKFKRSYSELNYEFILMGYIDKESKNLGYLQPTTTFVYGFNTIMAAKAFGEKEAPANKLLISNDGGFSWNLWCEHILQFSFIAYDIGADKRLWLLDDHNNIYQFAKPRGKVERLFQSINMSREFNAKKIKVSNNTIYLFEMPNSTQPTYQASIAIPTLTWFEYSNTENKDN